jgi:hypothetical protein
MWLLKNGILKRRCFVQTKLVLLQIWNYTLIYVFTVSFKKLCEFGALCNGWIIWTEYNHNYLYHKARKCHFASASTVCGRRGVSRGATNAGTCKTFSSHVIHKTFLWSSSTKAWLNNTPRNSSWGIINLRVCWISSGYHLHVLSVCWCCEPSTTSSVTKTDTTKYSQISGVPCL